MQAWTFITSSKYPTSESKVVGVYGFMTSSPWLSLPLFKNEMRQNWKKLIIHPMNQHHWQLFADRSANKQLENMSCTAKELISVENNLNFRINSNTNKPATYMLSNWKTQNWSLCGKFKCELCHIVAQLFALYKFEVLKVLRI